MELLSALDPQLMLGLIVIFILGVVVPMAASWVCDPGEGFLQDFLANLAAGSVLLGLGLLFVDAANMRATKTLLTVEHLGRVDEPHLRAAIRHFQDLLGSGRCANIEDERLHNDCVRLHVSEQISYAMTVQHLDGTVDSCRILANYLEDICLLDAAGLLDSSAVAETHGRMLRRFATFAESCVPTYRAAQHAPGAFNRCLFDEDDPVRLRYSGFLSHE